MLLIILLFHFLLLGYTSGDNDGNCHIDGISDYVFNIEMPDSSIDKIVFNGGYTGKLTDINCTADDKKVLEYFTVSEDGKNFTIRTTKKLADIDKNTPKQTAVLIILPMTCTMSCEAGTSTLLIQFIVTDTNNHAPRFLETEYTYKVASPIMPYTDFTIYGSKITVEDLDFSNKNMTFSIVPDDFDITTLINEKHYTAQLTAKKIIQLTDTPLTYTITATDSEATPKILSTSQKITIQGDSSKSLDSPSFKNPSYAFDYSVNGTTVTLSSRDGPISLTTNKPEAVAKGLKLTGDYKDNFTPTFNPADNTITLTATPVSSTSSFIILTLSVETDAVATTSIVVYLAGESTPEFSSHVYTATYTVDNIIELNEDIKVTTSRGTPEVTLSGGTEIDATKYFSLENKSGKYQIAVREALPPSILQNRTSLVLTLEADLAGAKGYATLIINLPKIVVDGEISFSQVLYNGFYNVTDGNVTLSIETIQVTTTATNVNVDVSISADSPFKSYFAVSYADGEVKLRSQTDLPEDILKETNVIPLTLVIGIKGKPDRALAVLNIEVSYNATGDTGRLAFNQFLYKGKYNKGNLTQDEDISIITDQTDDNIEVSVNNEYQDFFVAKYSGKLVTIVKGPSEIPAETLKNLTNIPLLLLAKIRGTSRTATAVINLVVISDTPAKTPTLAFAQLLYTGNYSIVDEKIKFEVSEQIQVDTDASEDKIDSAVTIDPEYAQYFKASYASKTVSVEASDRLPDDVLKTRAFIALKLTIKTKDLSVSSSAILNIEIIRDSPVKTPTLAFAQLLYSGNYSITDDKIQFQVNEKIQVNTDASEDEIDSAVTIDPEYAKYFKASYVNKTVSVAASDRLPDDILKTNAFIALKLTIKTKDSSVSSSAILNIEITSKPDVDTTFIAFSEVLYTGTYNVSGTSAVIKYDAISLMTNLTDENIKIEISNGFKKHFSVKLTDKSVDVSITSPISTDTLKNLTTIAITLTAQIVGTNRNSSAVLNLRIITDDKNQSGSIMFPEALHTGEYLVVGDKGILIIDDQIQVITDRADSEIETSISDLSGYSSYFSIIYSNREISVTVKSNLPDDVLKNNSIILLTLTASIKNSEISSSSVLNIKLPTDTPKTTLAFDQLLYTGNYSIVDETIQFQVNDKIQVNTDASEDEVDSAVTIDPDYAQYFEASYASKTVSVKASDRLPDDMLKTRAFIALKLTIKTKDLSVSSSAILNIEIISDSPVKTPTLAFAQLLYSGNYSITDDKIQFQVNEKIQVNTDASEDEIDSAVTIDPEYAKYFKASYVNKTVSVAASDRLPDDILKTNAFIALKLTIKTKDSSVSSSAILNIEITNDTPVKTSTLAFAQLLYSGNYSITDDKIQFQLNEKIQVNTDASEDEIESAVSIDPEYAQYFKASYASKTVSVEASDRLPDDVLKTKAFIALKLTIKTKDSSVRSSAILNIEITSKPDVDTTSIAFSEVLYSGTYNVTGTAAAIEYDAISLMTDQTDEKIQVDITNGFQKYFAVKQTKKSVSISVTSPIPTDTLKNLTTIAITLTAQIVATNKSSSAVLNLRIISDDNEKTGSIMFPEVLHTGEYSIVDGKGKLAVDAPIQVVTDRADNEIETSISDPSRYSSYFSLTYSSRAISVTVKSNLPDDVLKNNFISLTLTASIKNSSKSASSVLNIKLDNKPDVDTTSIAFSEVLYTGTYNVTGTAAAIEYDAISLMTDQTDEKIRVEISNGFQKYFSVKQTGKSVNISVTNPIPSDTLKNLTTIAITLTAQIVGTNKTSLAVLNLRIISDDNEKTGSILFPEVLHTGEYSIVDGKGKLAIEAPIQVVTDRADNEIETSISDPSGYSSYFSLTYSSRAISVTVKSNLPDDVLKNNFISLTLTASIKNSSKSASSVLNIKLDNKPDVDTTSIAFSEVLYTGTYNVTGTAAAIEYDAISLMTDQTDEKIRVEISNGFQKYFSVKQAGKSVNISVTNPIPSDTLKNLTTIAITLTAQIVGTNKTSLAVLNLRIISDDNEESGSIMFPEVLHTGEYSLIDGKGKLAVDTPIQVITERADNDIETSISDPLGYSSYFSSTYSSRAISVTVKSNLPDDVLKKNSFISLTLTASIKNSSKSSSSVLNIKLDNKPDVDTTSIAFSEVLYTGTYNVTGTAAAIEYDAISLMTDQTDEKILVEISNGFQEYFSVKLTDKSVNISIKSPIPTETLKNLTTIAIILTAQIMETNKNSSAVLSLRIIDDRNDTIEAKFTSFIYNGAYQIENNEATVRHDPIVLQTDQPDSSVMMIIKNEYAQYFSMLYSNKLVTVDLKNKAPSTTLQKLNNIPVELMVQIKGSQNSASAVLNLKVIGEQNANDTGVIAFQRVLYSGKYSVGDNGDEPKFTIEEIKVFTDNLGTDIEISAWDDYNYNQYFNFSYSNNAISVALIQQLPANVYKNINFIPITLTAKIKKSGMAASTVLNIEIDYLDHHDDNKESSVDTTGYIAAIVVLALLLIGLLAGAVAFYYFKIRNTKYIQMDDEDFGRVTFDKQARPSTKSLGRSSIEERRPTGFNFNPIPEDNPPKLETSPDTAANKGRRKSVAFNDNVQKLQLDAVNDDDIDKALDDRTEVTSL